MERRGFLQSTLIWLGTGVLTALAAVPSAVQLLAPVLASRKEGEDWFDLGPLEDFSAEKPSEKVIEVRVQDGWETRVQNQAVFVIKKAEELQVFSSICPHLSCPIAFDSNNSEFVCHCHNSFWKPEGGRISGPSPRDLDALPSKIENGRLLCRWVMYRPGESAAVEV